MAKLTALDLASAVRLGRDYGLRVEGLELLEQGSVNSNFRLTTAEGESYFGRIYEEQSARGARAELELLCGLDRAGVPIALPIAKDRAALEEAPDSAEPDRALEFVSEYLGKPVAVYPWIDGDILCQARVTVRHLSALGRALAAIHQASAGLGHVPTGRFEAPQLLERLARVARERADFVGVAKDIKSKLEQYAAERNADLPSGLIHADLFRDNVLWHRVASSPSPLDADASAVPRILALIDFESACRGSFVFDLMVTIHAWCYRDEFDLDLVRALVEGYESVRPLESRERASYLVEGALAALRFAVTRITDFSLRALPGEPPLRDYRRFLARLQRLEQGALAEVFDLSERRVKR